MKAADRKWIFRESECFEGLRERRDKIDRATEALKKMRPTSKKYTDKENALANHKRHLATQIHVCRPRALAAAPAPLRVRHPRCCLTVHLWLTSSRAGL